MKPGDRVSLRNNLGDFFEGQHVIVPRGTLATIVEIFKEPDDVYQKVLLAVPDSPGQKTLTTAVKDFNRIWTTKLPLTVWERLRRDAFKPV